MRIEHDDGASAWFRFPVERFYLPEAKAQVAERLTWRPDSRAWAELRIHEGQATLVDVFVDGVPLLDAAGETLQREEERAERSPRTR